MKIIDSFENLASYRGWIIDKKVYNAHLSLQKWVKQAPVFLVEDPESCKNWDYCKTLLQFFFEHGFTRADSIAVVGGGALSDLSGFALSIYKRGIQWSVFPTTLLAMIDASIGGKTALNFDKIKNGVGTFYTPKEIFFYLPFLETLSPREYESGMGEALKYGLIASETLWKELSPIGLTKTQILECAKIKEKITKKDPLDKGIRHILNFGHTFAHGYESALQGKCLHGEAVALGILVESHLSFQRGLLSFESWQSIFQKVMLFNYSWEEIEFSKLVPYFLHDKKKQDDGLLCHLLEKIGKAPKLYPIATEELQNSYETVWTLRSPLQKI